MKTFNASPKKTPMAMQDGEKRVSNFDEVALGYTEEEAILEARRCLHCKNAPCVKGCPVGVNIPAFLALVSEGDFEGAYEEIEKSSSLAAICGRVCPQETQCEGNCTRGVKAGCESVAIGRIERFVAEYGAKERVVETKENGGKVAIVGSGPAGLSCASELKKAGYAVTIFEALHEAGGVLTYGIPEFRLPKKIVKREIERLKETGVKIETNVVIGRTVSVKELFDEYGFDAVFIGSGAGLPKFMGLEGENAKGVYSANEFLTRINLMGAYKDGAKTPVYTGKRVAVVGGGNVATDAARCARRSGADTYIVYRRGEEELPARKEEVEHAKEEGVVFKLYTNPVRILKDEDPKSPAYGFVRGLECVRTELGEADASGRRSPKEVAGSEFVLPVDCVIMAIGTSPNPLLAMTTEGLETKPRGEIYTNERGETSLSGVFCGGDASTGAATVIKAMGAGKLAAKSIDEYVRKKRRA